jgi:HEPN domain-containing protein
VNRDDFRKLAETRLEDAKALLKAGRFDAAYYLAGYAVECALKACLCGRTREFDFPPKPKDVNDYYTHDLDALLTTAKLRSSLKEESRTNTKLAAYWSVVKDWKEDRRYLYTGSDTERGARALIEAISDPEHGVLQWLAKYDGRI